jgi:molybdopterin-guanine dinucleotide biosynthesis protein A
MIAREDITGLILAGGRGARMGGVDKGLQHFNGLPLALHTLQRLQPQVGRVLVNANRNLPSYEAFGARVCTDALPDFAGPLAGFMTGLTHCDTPWLVTVPCDTPLFPLDLVTRLAQAVSEQDADIAVARASESDGARRPQPVFCLMRRTLSDSLDRFLREGGRKIDAWTAQHHAVLVDFDTPGDDPRAFANANTLDELHRLEQEEAR